MARHTCRKRGHWNDAHVFLREVIMLQELPAKELLVVEERPGDNTFWVCSGTKARRNVRLTSLLILTTSLYGKKFI